jgi:hypothetical protein
MAFYGFKHDQVTKTQVNTGRIDQFRQVVFNHTFFDQAMDLVIV